MRTPSRSCSKGGLNGANTREQTLCHFASCVTNYRLRIHRAVKISRLKMKMRALQARLTVYMSIEQKMIPAARTTCSAIQMFW